MNEEGQHSFGLDGVGDVDLVEGAGGVRMISNIVDAAPEELAIGLPVEVAWEDMSTDLAIPRFRIVRE